MISLLYYTLPHHLVKEKHTESVEQNLNREGSLYLACNEKRVFFTSEQPTQISCGSVRKCVMLSIIFWTINF